MILTISTAFGLLATDTLILIHINAPPLPSKSSWYTNRCRDDLGHKDNQHILTSVFGVQRLSSSIYLHPDSSPFCYFSRSGSNGSRLACQGNKHSYSKIKPPIVLDLPMNLGIKKERLSIPNVGQIDALCTSRYSILSAITAWYWKHPPFLISRFFSTILGLISRKGIFISKNSPFSAKN